MAAILPEFRSISGLIVAGGRASRLGGAEKALLVAGGRRLVDPALDLLERLFAEVLVATPRPDAWAGLRVRVVADEMPDAGPLGGLAAGLSAASTPWVFACAGDMPLLDARVVRWLCGHALALGRPVVPRASGRPEPLHAVYRSADATAARAALAAGVRKMTAWLPEEGVAWVDVETLRGLPGAAGSLRNVNAPDDLAAIRKLLDAGGVRGETSSP